MWEESPIGTWTLEVINDGRSLVELKAWHLVFLGTNEHPQPNLHKSNPQTILQQPSLSITNPQSMPTSNINQINPNEALNKAPSQPIQDVSQQKNPGPIDAFVKQEPKITLENCLQQSLDNLECKKCQPNFLLLNGKCLHDCPKGYYKGEIGYDHHKTCLKCYYSCKTCTGPNDNQCLSCYEDATLEEESHGQNYCHNKSLNDQVKHTSRWYYVLTIGFMVNFCIICILVVYIVRYEYNYRPTDNFYHI